MTAYNSNMEESKNDSKFRLNAKGLFLTYP